MFEFNSGVRKPDIIKFSFLLVTTIILILSCQNPTAPEETIFNQNGKLISAEIIAVFDTSKLNRILNEELEQFLDNSSEPFSSFKGKYQTPTSSVTLYKLTYRSSVPEKNNEPAIATGIIAIPSNLAAEAPMVSYQHGTVLSKTGVPSFIEESMETKLSIAHFAGNGYILIAADYHGQAESTLKNSYFVQKTTEQACLDLYLSAQEFLKQQNINIGKFFTFGWSQGAYNTLTYLRRLEQEGIPVSATATAATPSDLNYFIVRSIVNPRPEDAPWGVACLSNMLYSYEHYLGLEGLPEKAIRPEYLQYAIDLYEHKIEFPEFFEKTPHTVADFLKLDFIEEIQLGSSPFCSTLNASEGYRWRSTTPLRSYYGEGDEAISVDLGKLAIEYQASLGKKNGELVNAGQHADHRATYAYALYHVKPWFDSFIIK
jgi:pimeloyl-ACP methyl ester carboxylesterase